MKRSPNTFSLLGLFVSLSAGPLSAAPEKPPASAPVVVRGRVVARLYTANAGLAPAARAALAISRLAAVAETGVAAAAIVTRPLGEGIGVYVRDQLVLVATPAEAATRGIPTAALAERWAGGLRTVLAGSNLSPSPASSPRRGAAGGIPSAPKRGGETATAPSSLRTRAPEPKTDPSPGPGAPPPKAVAWRGEALEGQRSSREDGSAKGARGRPARREAEAQPVKPLKRGTPTASTRVTGDRNVSEGSAALERLHREPVVNPSTQGRPVPPRPAVPLALAERHLALPLGETRAVRVSGVTGALVIEVGAPAAEAGPDWQASASAHPRRGPTDRLARAAPLPVEAQLASGDRADTRLLQVRGLAAGRTTVRLRMGDQTAELAVRVMPYAARVVGPVEVTVTGRPAPAARVRECVLGRRAEALALEPGAEIFWGASRRRGRLKAGDGRTGPLDLGGDLPAGESRAVSLPARVTAPDCFPFETVVTVNVRNRELAARDTALLFYSNDPERVTACAPLFLGDLEPDAPARLLYHHLNGTGRPFAFRVDLLNPGAAPAEVQVIDGSAGPSGDPVLVGHRAALRFGQNWPADVGRVVTVPPGARRAIVAQRVPDGLTVSGLLGLRVVSGATLRVRVAAEPDAVPLEEALGPAAEGAPSAHVYPSPRKELLARYRVGDRWTFIPVGQRPIAGRNGAPRLDGNYGVQYDIDLRLENPTDRERTVSVALSPDAGDARGVFWIGGQLVEAPALSPPMDGVLASFRLAPGEARAVPIRTLPVAGSAYPARLVVRAAPLPAGTPPPAGAAALR